MSNLYKSVRVLNSSNPTRVIDSNEKVMSRLESIREQMVKEETPADGFVQGLDLETVEVLAEEGDALSNEETMAYAKEEANAILHNAKKEYDSIINNAQVKALEIRENASAKGYEEGYAKAIKDVDVLKEQQAQELKDYKQKLQKEYEDMKAQIEPQLVDTLLTVFSKVTHTMADSNRDTIIHLVESVMRNTEISRDFLIKVSKEDYQFMINSKDKLYEHVSKNVRIEIYQDTSLKRNQCVIETDAGVFDCSLDIQLENLVKEIRILSCLVD